MLANIVWVSQKRAMRLLVAKYAEPMRVAVYDEHRIAVERTVIPEVEELLQSMGVQYAILKACFDHLYMGGAVTHTEIPAFQGVQVAGYSCPMYCTGDNSEGNPTYITACQHTAELKYNRRLGRSEVAIPLDGNYSNYHPDNVVVFHTKTDVQRFRKRYPLNYNFATGVYSTQPDFVITSKKNICQCGKWKSSEAKMCQECATHTKRENLGLHLTRYEIKKLLRNNSVTSIAKMLNCSDSSIRRFCMREGLPTTRKEVCEISDADWVRI